MILMMCILLLQVIILAVIARLYIRYVANSLGARSIQLSQMDKTGMDNSFHKYRDQFIKMLRQRDNEFEQRLLEKNRYYESLLEARRQRDSVYDFVKNRSVRETHFRQVLERRNSELSYKIRSMRQRIKSLSKHLRLAHGNRIKVKGLRAE